MKIKRKIIYILVALFCAIMLFFIPSFAKKTQTAQAVSVDDNYRFTEIDTTISVNKDKTYDICERLTVYFNEGGVNTGIIRDIQRITRVTRYINGVAYVGQNYFTDVTDVSVTLDGGYCKVTREFYDNGQFYSIKMQNPDGYMDALSKHVFELKYKYHDGGGKLEGFDDFTFDVLGYAMARTDKFSATVTFPADAPLSNVQIRQGAGEWNADETAGESWSVDGNTITMTAFPRTVAGFTVQVILPDGYFNDHKVIFWYYYIFIVLAVISVAVLLGLFFQWNRKPLEVISYYPPSGSTLAQFYTLWRGCKSPKDACMYVLKWARQGIVSIVSDGDGHVTVKANVLKAKGLKKAPSKRLPQSSTPYFDNTAEEDYFDKIFSGIGGLNYTCSTRLLRKAYSFEKKALYDASDSLMARGNRPEVVKEGKKSLRSNILPFISFIPMACAVGYSCTLFCNPVMLFLLIFMAAGTGMTGVFRAMRLPIILLFPIMFTAVPYGLAIFMGFNYIDADASLLLYDYALLFAIAPVIWLVGCFVLPYFVQARTSVGEKLYGQMLGFKRFLLTAEKPRLEMLFDVNPEYFSEILPYCYIMGISEKVRKRLSALKNFVAPAYLINDPDFDSFRRTMRHTCADGHRFSSLSGGGGFGGSSGGGGGSGGSSGGGSGGGGSRGC